MFSSLPLWERDQKWAEIDLDALAENVKRIRSRIPEKTRLMAVVKADAYGHGDGWIGRELEQLGVTDFGVSNLDEARSLRAAGVKGEILIFGTTPVEQLSLLCDDRITQTVYSTEYAEALSDAAQKIGRTPVCHLKVDTGMGRIGISADAIDEMEHICRLPGLRVEGIFSHFSSSDDVTEEGIAYTERQHALFDGAVEALKARGINFKVRHLQNSGGILNYPEYEYEMVRAGIILYGLPLETLPGKELELEPMMAIRSVISMVKRVHPGDAISYSRKFIAEREMTVATVPIGYADGYLRAFSGKLCVLVHGVPAPIVGSICMDQMMIDVSAIDNVAAGDIATVVGRDGERMITFCDLARVTDSIHYEILCLVGKRVPRIYLKNGKMVGRTDLLHR